MTKVYTHTFRLPQRLVDDVRDACAHLHIGLHDFLKAATTAYLLRLQNEHNNGQKFQRRRKAAALRPHPGRRGKGGRRRGAT